MNYKYEYSKFLVYTYKVIGVVYYYNTTNHRRAQLQLSVQLTYTDRSSVSIVRFDERYS